LNPYGVAVDNSGNVYIADTNNNRIRKVDSSGIISTIAGTGVAGYSGDGSAASSAQLSNPNSIAVDNSGNIYIGDSNNYRIRKINSSGIISTIAGTGVSGYSGDNSAASSAKITKIYSITINGIGDIYFTDHFNNVIRKINSSGIITSVPGSGSYGIAIDSIGNIYASIDNNIYKTNTSGIQSQIAGAGIGYSGDGGPSYFAKLNSVSCIAFDNSGNLYITDTGNNRVRVIYLNGLNQWSMIGSSRILPYTSISGATGVVSHDLSLSNIFYHTGILANFTCNIINIPLVGPNSYTITLVLSQGGSAYLANAVQISGVSAMLYWANSSVPTPVPSSTSIQTINLYYLGVSWLAMSTYSSYS